MCFLSFLYLHTEGLLFMDPAAMFYSSAEWTNPTLVLESRAVHIVVVLSVGCDLQPRRLMPTDLLKLYRTF